MKDSVFIARGPLGERFIRPKEMSKIFGITTRNIKEMALRGDLPMPRQLGRRAIGWLASEVIYHIESRPVVKWKRAA